MRKLVLTLTAATLVLGMTALTASAQTQAPGAAGLHAQANNFTPMVQHTACGGFGPFCGPGWVRRCWRGPYGYPHCRCVPCY
jgi:Spy/CpxP family protein refolding chaperone